MQSDDADLFRRIQETGRFRFGVGRTQIPQYHEPSFSAYAAKFRWYGKRDAQFVLTHPGRAHSMLFHLTVRYPVWRPFKALLSGKPRAAPYFWACAGLRIASAAGFLVSRLVPHAERGKISLPRPLSKGESGQRNAAQPHPAERGGASAATGPLAVIVQARMGSSRAPGKVMENLAGQPFLKHCLDRCRQIPGADMVVVAIPETPENDVIAASAARWGYRVVRGSESDVLSRYARAARATQASAVMRVTSDCPLIDPAICGQTIDWWRTTGADYGCNNMPPGLPHGLDCEVFHAGLLLKADSEAQDPYAREHVTPWLRTHSGLTRASLQGPGGGLEHLRWTLDYPEDMAMFRELFAAMGSEAVHATAADFIAFCLRRPDIAAMNAVRHAAERLTATDRADHESLLALTGKAA